MLSTQETQICLQNLRKHIAVTKHKSPSTYFCTPVGAFSLPARASASVGLPKKSFRQADAPQKCGAFYFRTEKEKNHIFQCGFFPGKLREIMKRSGYLCYALWLAVGLPFKSSSRLNLGNHMQTDTSDCPQRKTSDCFHFPLVWYYNTPCF